MKKKYAKIWMVVLVMVVVNLACGLPKFGKEDAEPLPVEAEASAPLGETYRSDEGGFSFEVIPGYTVEEFYGLVSVLAPDADPDVGPGIMLIGGENEEARTLDQLVDEFKAGLEQGNEVSNQREVTIDGIPGVALDIAGTENGKALAGRVVLTAITPTRVFNVMGFAPPESWAALAPQFEALLATVRFFEPVAGSEEPEAPPEQPAPVEEAVPQEIIRQWGTSATAGSEYDNPDWGAHQATGAPDTPECGDHVTAWASYDQFAIEWLEVGYDTPVIPLEVNVYESHTPTQVAKVELLDTSGNYHVIYTGKPRLTDCPYIVSIQVKDADYQAVAVKVTVDQSKLGVPWDEIDAVELVGYGTTPVAASPAEPTAEPLAQPTSESPPVVGGGTDLSSWTWTNYTSSEGLSDNNTRSIAVAPDGTVWVGTFGAGVARFKNGSFTSYSTEDGLGHKQVMAMEVTGDGMVWAGTILGLSRFDGSSWTNYTKADGLIYESVYALAAGDNGGLWVGTGRGVSFYDGAWTNFTKEDGLADNYVNDIAVDGSGGVWFATMKGVSFYDGSWTTYTAADGLAFDIVNTVAVAPDGRVWFGTSSQGTSHFNGSTWTTYADDASIPAEYVTAIRKAQDGMLWFATQGDGIFRFDGQTWLNFTKSGGAGLLSDSLEDAAIAPDGAVWFCYQNKGIVRFGP